MAKHSRTGPNADKIGTSYRLLCLQCNRGTNHKVISSAEYTFEQAYGDDAIMEWNDYQILECQGCDSISFRHFSSNTEDYDVNPETDEIVYLESEKLFPPRHEGRAEIDGYYKLPNNIRSIYQETLSAFRSDLPILTGVGLRAIVETICNEQGAAGRTLQLQIDDLVTRHVLTPDGARILHSLRVMGNAAAHNVAPHSLEQLNTAFEVVEYVLKGVYILPERARTLPS